MKLRERVALVTGGGRGIGREIALLFAKEGAKVGVTARSADEIAAVVNEIVGDGGNAIGVTGDVSQQEDVRRMVAETTGEFGRIDILVNNAGIMQGGPFVTFDPADWRRVIEVNLMGTFYCTQAVAPMLIEQGWGRIINISSRSGKIGIPYLTAYVASKHGVVGFTKALAEELAPFNITINAVCPAPSRPIWCRRRSRSVSESCLFLRAMSPISRFTWQRKRQPQSMARRSISMAARSWI